MSRGPLTASAQTQPAAGAVRSKEEFDLCCGVSQQREGAAEARRCIRLREFEQSDLNGRPQPRQCVTSTTFLTNMATESEESILTAFVKSSRPNLLQHLIRTGCDPLSQLVRIRCLNQAAEAEPAASSVTHVAAGSSQGAIAIGGLGQRESGDSGWFGEPHVAAGS